MTAEEEDRSVGARLVLRDEVAGTYDVQLALSSVFDTKAEGLSETFILLAQCEEGLVWFLSAPAICGCKSDFEGVGSGEGDGGG